MIVYNVTVKVEEDIREDWESWMVQTHIPDVMKTGFFLEAQIRKVMIHHEDGDTTFSIQYKCRSMRDLEQYQDQFAAALQAEHQQRYRNKYVAFRTVMEEVHSF